MHGSLHCRACPLPQAISGGGWPVASATGQHLAVRIGQGPTVSEVHPRAARVSAGSAAGTWSCSALTAAAPPAVGPQVRHLGVRDAAGQFVGGNSVMGAQARVLWPGLGPASPPAGKGPRLIVLQVSSEASLPCPRTGSVCSWDSRSKKLLSRAVVPRRGDWILPQEGMSGAGPEHPPAVPGSLVCTLAPGG